MTAASKVRDDDHREAIWVSAQFRVIGQHPRERRDQVKRVFALAHTGRRLQALQQRKIASKTSGS